MKYVVFFLMFIIIPVFGQKKWIYPCALNNILKSNQLAEYVTSESSSSNRHLCFQIDTIKLNCNFAVFATEILKNKGKDLWKENVKPDLINQIEDSLSKVSIKFNRDTNAPFILSQKTFDCSQKTEYLLITFTNYSNDLGIVARIRMINNRVAEIQGRDLFMYIEFDKKKRIKKYSQYKYSMTKISGYSSGRWLSEVFLRSKRYKSITHVIGKFNMKWRVKYK